MNLSSFGKALDYGSFGYWKEDRQLAYLREENRDSTLHTKRKTGTAHYTQREKRKQHLELRGASSEDKGRLNDCYNYP